jgi:hypothetical protein
MKNIASTKKRLLNIIAVLFCTLLSQAVWANTPTPPAMLSVQGMTLKINLDKTSYTEGGLMQGEGLLYVPILSQELTVTFDNVRLDAFKQLEDGVIKATMARELFNRTGIKSLESPDFQDNAVGMKALLTAAKNQTGQLPLLINKLSTYSAAKFGKLSVLLTELTITKMGTTAAIMAIEQTPEGLYMPFTNIDVEIDPLSKKDFGPMTLSLPSNVNTNDPLMSITYVKHDPTNATGTFAQLDCNGLNYYQIGGKYDFSKDNKIKAALSTDLMIASFQTTSKHLSQFVAKFTPNSIKPFTLNAHDAVVFEVGEATIDNSDTTEIAGLPRKFQNGNQWKGIYIQKTKVYLQTLNLKKDGAWLKYDFPDNLYTKGDGFFSGEMLNESQSGSIVNEAGFLTTVSSVNIIISKNSFEKLALKGTVTLPGTSTSISYEGTLSNSTQKANEPQAQLNFTGFLAYDKWKGSRSEPISVSTSFLSSSTYKLTGGNVKIKSFKDKVHVLATLTGSFDINVPQKDIIYSISAGEWTIGELPKEGAIQALNVEELPMEIKSVASVFGSAAEFVRFPLVIKSGVLTGNAINGYSFSFEKTINLGWTSNGTSKFSVTGGITLSFKADAAKLKTNPSSALTFVNAQPTKYVLKADLSKVIMEGSLEFFENQTEKYFKAAGSLEIKDLMTIEASGIFGKKTEGGNSYNYFYIEAAYQNEKVGVALGTSGLFYYGFGGGIFNNMSPKVDIEKGTVAFEPKNGSFGFSASIFVGAAKKEMFEAKGTLIVALGTNWSFESLTISVQAGALNLPDRKAEEALLIGNGVIQLDFANKVFQAGFQCGTNANYTFLPTVKGTLSFRFKLDNASDWQIKLGEPAADKRCVIPIGALTASGYFMMGTNLPGISSTVQDVSKSNGIAFGVTVSTPQKRYDIGIAWTRAYAYCGFDASLLQSKEMCGNRKIGLNGWYLTLSATAGIYGEADSPAKPGPSIKLNLSVSVEAGLPNPIYVKATFRVLGVNFTYEHKTGCDN